MKFDVTGIPDDLPPGTYATRVKNASVENNVGILITLEYKGKIDPDNPTLFTMTKHEDGTIN